MSFGRTSNTSALPPIGPNPNNDTEITQPPTDGISSIEWSPAASHLLATSWDCQVRCWEVNAQGQSQPKVATNLGQPLLCSAWAPDGSVAFAGGCDKQVTMWSLATNQTQVVAKHDAPIPYAFHVKDMSNMLVTGSWDRTIKYWDLRSQNPVHTQQLPERVYGMDIKYPLMVVGLAGRRLQVFNLTKPQAVFKELESPLKYQTRSITCFPDSSGYLVGSVEGRVAVHHVDDSQQTKNFTFKCQRVGADVYAVNVMKFHPVQGTFVTAGGDGSYNFWDKDTKHRLKQMGQADLPIPCGAFNNDGSIFSYALSYDWGQGYAAYNPSNARNSIMLHKCASDEVMRKPANRSTRR